MRFVIAFLAVAGIVVSSLALHVHYSNDIQPCDINARWDCGIVNHSRYAVFHGIPVAVFGIIGYATIAVLALSRRSLLTLICALAGLAYALYLSNIEAHLLGVWCLYCAISQGLIALITLLAIAALFIRPRPRPAV
jgi:vitamin-K-epoxide reductase (warfarin-sensitive)